MLLANILVFITNKEVIMGLWNYIESKVKATTVFDIGVLNYYCLLQA